MQFQPPSPSISPRRGVSRETSGIPPGSGFRCSGSTANNSRGTALDMFLVSRVDLIAPLPRPLIQILPTAEGAPGQEVILDEMEGTFHAPRTIGIPHRVRHELKAEALPKGGHLRHPRHLASAAAQHH